MANNETNFSAMPEEIKAEWAYEIWRKMGLGRKKAEELWDALPDTEEELDALLSQPLLLKGGRG